MKLLVLDGGGALGIGQARILDKIDAFNKFDAFVGTSIGSANASAIAMNLGINLTDFFHEEMPKIFNGHWYKKYKPIAPKYNDNAINRSLKHIFGTTYLGDAKKPLFICSVNLKNEKLKVFNSLSADDGGTILWEAVRSSTAAPTYFSPYKGYIDGGIYANAPIVVGIAGVAKQMNCKLSDIEVCSIGTGMDDTPQNIRQYSYLSWGVWLLKATLGGSGASMNDFIARQLPLKKYTRIDFFRDSKWSMDSASDMLEAEIAWENDIQRGIQIVKDF